MHGTGTALGDPIEIGASTSVLQGAYFPAPANGLSYNTPAAAESHMLIVGCIQGVLAPCV